MRPLAVTLCVACWSSAAIAQPVQLRAPDCDVPWATYDSLALALRVELRGSGSTMDAIPGVAAGLLVVRIEDCQRPRQLSLAARYEDRVEEREVDLSDISDAMASRTLAMALVALWEIVQRARLGTEILVREGSSSGASSGRARHAGFRLDEPRAGRVRRRRQYGFRAGTHPERRPDVLPSLHIGGDSTAYAMGPDVLPGGRVGLGLLAGWFGSRISVTLQGLRAGEAGASVDLVVGGIDLAAGPEVRVDDVVFAFVISLRAGVVWALPENAAAVGVSGTLDLAVTLRARWLFADPFGVELESGVGYALIPYELAGTPGRPGWSEWWVPMRLSLSVALS